tara:strand:- start:4909 stop:5361 length:453 start_codon:yes stop_codon:yes gene_type:complete
MQIKTLSVVFLLLFVTGCSSIPGFKPQPMIAPEPIIKTVTEYKTLEIYQPPLPEEIRLEDVEFFVITEKNFDEQVAKLEKMQSGTYVLFGLTPQDYENMAYNLQELRRYVRQQKEIILYYRQATQDDAGTDSEDWLEHNKEIVQDQLTSP